MTTSKASSCWQICSSILMPSTTVRSRIMKLFGVLGVHFPDVSPELGELICHDQMTSSEYRQKHLSLDVTFELFLRGLQGKATAGNFNSFVSMLAFTSSPRQEKLSTPSLSRARSCLGNNTREGNNSTCLGRFRGRQLNPRSGPRSLPCSQSSVSTGDFLPRAASRLDKALNTSNFRSRTGS